MSISTTIIVALSVTALSLVLLRPCATRLGFVDHPTPRKQHTGAIPMIGGLALYLGFISSILYLHVIQPHLISLLAGGSLLLLMGAIDDRCDLNPKLRLAVQALAGILLITCGHIEIDHLGHLFSSSATPLGFWQLPLTVIAVVGFINAMNMLDGQDGLAGVIALGQLFWLMLFAYFVNDTLIFQLSLSLLMGVIAFLVFNLRLPKRPSALVFLGDSGIMFLAFVVAWLAIDLPHRQPQLEPMTLLWIVAFPVFDCTQVVIHRYRLGLSPIRPSHHHAHHVLAQYQISMMQSTGLLGLFAWGLGLMGMIFYAIHLGAGWQLLIWCLCLMGYLWGLNKLRRSN